MLLGSNMEITGKFRSLEPWDHRMAEFGKHLWRSSSPEPFRPFSEKLLCSQVTLSAWHLGCLLLRCRNLCFTLSNFMAFLSTYFSSLSKISLDVSLMIWSISHSFWFCVISKYSEATLCLITQVINEDFKQNWAQY